MHADWLKIYFCIWQHYFVEQQKQSTVFVFVHVNENMVMEKIKKIEKQKINIIIRKWY